MTDETPMKTIINCETGEVQVLPFTQEEINQRLADQAEFEAKNQARDAAIAAKAAAKASAEAKLAALGLTPEEIAAL
jgi:MinD-like ATPase involved in chromosome partitioning or flagellar assembly